MNPIVRKLLEGSAEGAARQWDADFVRAMRERHGITKMLPVSVDCDGRQIAVNLDGTPVGDPHALLGACYAVDPPTMSVGHVVALARLVIRLEHYTEMFRLEHYAAIDRDARRYRFLRSRDVDTIAKGGVFAGLTPDNFVLTEEHLDAAVDAAIDRAEGRT